MLKKNYLKKQLLLASLSLATSGIVFAGAMGPVKQGPKLYLGIEGGASVSSTMHFQPEQPSPRIIGQSIFATPVNTDFSRDMGTGGLVGAYLGYEWNPNVAFQFGYAFRSDYNWDISVVEDDAQTAAIGALPDVYDRYSARGIQIHTFLVDMLLKPTVNWGGFVPYAKIGVGASLNHIRQFRDIDIPTSLANNEQVSFDVIVAGHTKANFAWDVGAGADYYFNDAWSVGINYRFVDAGALQTGTTFHDTVLLVSGPIAPFKAKHVYLNEATASLTYHFDWA